MDPIDDGLDESRHHCGVDMLGAHVYLGDAVVAACCSGRLHVCYVDSCDGAGEYVLIPIVRVGGPFLTGVGSVIQAWHRDVEKHSIFCEMAGTVKVDLGCIRVHM